MADSASVGDGGAAAAAAAAASNYKKLKEDFVSNLSGGSAEEVFLVTAVAPVSQCFMLLNFHLIISFHLISPAAHCLLFVPKQNYLHFSIFAL